MLPAHHPARQAIAIVGVSALFPGSADANGFWRDILQGRDLLSDVPATHWRIEDYYDPDPNAPDKTYARRGGFLSPVNFDALGWGVPPSTMPATDTAQLLALIVAQSVLQDAAGAKFATMDRSKISVILGVTSAQELLFSMVSRLQRPVWVKALRETGLAEAQVQEACTRIADHYVPWQEASFPGLLGNVVAGRIANRLNLGGTNCVTDAACASTFSALSMAVNELQLGHSELVIAGGVDTLNDIFMYMCFSKTPALSPTGDCRPFSDQADGTMLGEGLGMVALKRLADAERDGDQIYVVLKGIGTASDGRSKSVYAPVAAGQAKALQRAYDIAGYSPETVELMEAHGTGTKAGDAAEFEGLRMVFSADSKKTGWCALGSVKSQIGHTKAAAGAAGLFKAVMALHHKILPPSIKIAAPNPKLAIEQSPFYLNTQARPWIKNPAHPRRASVSAFGFGGSNFHVTLEEYCSANLPRAIREGENTTIDSAHRAPRLYSHSHELILLRAATTAALSAKIAAMAEESAGADATLAHIAHRSRSDWDQCQINDNKFRLAIVTDRLPKLQEKLRFALAHLAATPEQPLDLPDGLAYGSGDLIGKVAFLFPGQGSQYLGMGSQLAMQFDVCRAIWDQAAATANSEPSLHEVMFPKPVFSDVARAEQQQRLTQTQFAQPAIAAHSAALLALLNSLGVTAEMSAGHSFGEIMALHAAGSFDAQTALHVARTRGALMRAAASKTSGAMCAVSASLLQTRAAITAAQVDLVIANHNSPTQVVVSGTVPAIEAFEAYLQSHNLAFKRLPVATAFHSPIVAQCVPAFEAALATQVIAAPKLPVYHNANALPYPQFADTVIAQLANQLAQPVNFVDMLHAMHADGARLFVEVGPGNVLSGLTAAILADKAHKTIALDRKSRDGVESLLLGLAQLAASGVALRASALFSDTRLPTEPLSGTNKLSIAINGSNFGKPYPPADPCAYPRANSVAIQATESVIPRELTNTMSTANPMANAALAARSDASTAPTAQPQPESMPITLASPTRDIQVLQTVSRTEASAAWLSVFQENQQRTASVHDRFMQSMNDAHQSYLRLAEAALIGLAQSNSSAGVQHFIETPQSNVRVSSRSAASAPVVSQEMPSNAQLRADSPTQSLTTTAAIPTIASNSQPKAILVATARASGSMATAPLALAPLLLEIVAEKTGYPVEMLQLDMDLEGDLGIDSIKRVEILASVDERVPSLPKLDRSKLSALHTLQEIVDYLQAQANSSGANRIEANFSPVLSSVSLLAPANIEAKPSAAVELAPLLLSVVAEKTGYPVEMLQLDMDLEGDLGIDSIKRVEILASVDELAPDLPKVDRAKLSALHTLREIVNYLQAQSKVAFDSEPNSTIATPATSNMSHVASKTSNVAADAATPERRPESNVELAPLLLNIVAEKTGYPVDMLQLDMDLEGDLGIDSIKRVEILASVDERAPDLPKVDRAKLSGLHTLREIVDYLQAQPPQLPSKQAAPEQAITTETTIRPGAQASATLASQPSENLIDRFILERVPAPATGFAMSGLLTGTMLYLIGEPTLANALAQTLQARGIAAQAVQQLPEDASACVYLGGLRKITSVDAAIAINREAFQLARQLAPRLQSQAGLFVTVQDTGGGFGLTDIPRHRAWLSGLSALVKTCALEWPLASLKAIDLQSETLSVAAQAEMIAAELLAGGGEIEIALAANGARHSLRSVARAVNGANADATPLHADDVVVVSGGARGVTAACVLALAARHKPRLVLLGRTPNRPEPNYCNGLSDATELKHAVLAHAKRAGEVLSPSTLNRAVQEILASREIQQTLAQLAAMGCNAHYLEVDITDRAAINAALQNVRSQWGPIKGLVHAAGVLADKRILDKSDAQFDAVFDTKVAGLRALLEATASDPLRMLCVFSSVSARCGNTGQADYAMANEVLAKVACDIARRNPGLRVKSFGWGPWEGGMVSPHLKARFQGLGVPMIGLARGAAQFVDELSDASEGSVELVLGGEPRAEALLFDGAELRVCALEFNVGRDNHSFLTGHSIDGLPVVPMVLIAEWLTRAARSFRSGYPHVVLHELSALKGIRLTGFDQAGDLLRIEARPKPGANRSDVIELALLLRDVSGRARYSARAELSRLPADGSAEKLAPQPLTLEPWASAAPYPKNLFHREAFELIDVVHGISDQGIRAEVRGLSGADWPTQPWHFDVAAFDAGMQLAVLFGQRVLGGNNLPTQIGTVQHFAHHSGAGPMTATAYRRALSGAASTTDIVFTDAEGNCLAQLLGVQNHRLAG